MNFSENFIYSLRGNDDESIITEINLENGYVNATKLCKSAGKFWGHYYSNKRTKDFLNELSKHIGIPLGELVSSKKGSNYGTWVHPDVAIDLASWCSTKFQVAVAKLVRRYMSGELTTNESLEVAKMANDTKILITSYHSKPVVYIGRVRTHEFNGAKIGRTDDLSARAKTHIIEMGNFELIKVYETLNNKNVETRLLDECKLRGVRRTCTINGKIQTELVEFSQSFTWNNLLQLAQDIVDKNPHPIIVAKDKKIKELQTSLENSPEMIRKLELEIELLKHQQTRNDEENVPITSPKLHPIEAFIDMCCETGIDTTANKYRVTYRDIYKKYAEKHFEMYSYLPICEAEFHKYMKQTLKYETKMCNWSYKTYVTYMNIRIKEQPTTLIQKLIPRFIDAECVLGEHYITDSKVLYDKFEGFVAMNGLNASKQNGISRQIFKVQLVEICKEITYKHWGIDGKKHGFMGIKLKDCLQFSDIVQMFVEEKCHKVDGLRIKTTDLYTAFQSYAQDKEYPLTFTHIQFYNMFEKQNPDITKQYITKSNMGYVGISTK